ncbi:MAG: hypothetical protein IPL28_21705 [Chloroflexi bacterium]|nr:hypothetical protein [Chloroflexota bacterium]MDA0243966.1 hypothetical protein [Chloroflexota bacterium]
MSETNNTNAIVYDGESGRKLALIVLNGYNIAAGGPLGKSGAMRSFKILKGNLWDEWSERRSLMVRAEDGRTADARVAALPAEENSSGLIEFI